MHYNRWILSGLIAFAASANASDVGMVGDLPADALPATSAVGMVGTPTNQSSNSASTQKDFFVHANGGWFHRDMRADSGFFCLDRSSGNFNSSCANTQSWTHPRSASVWGIGLGVRYNPSFTLDFARWSFQRQKTRQVSGSSHLSLNTSLVTALYQANVPLFGDLLWMPEVGFAYVHNRARGFNSGQTVDAKSVTWRPVMGMGFLYKPSERWGVTVSGLYLPQAGHSPVMAAIYPGIAWVVAGVRYYF